MLKHIITILLGFLLNSCAQPQSLYPTLDTAEVEAEKQRQLDISHAKKIEDRHNKKLKYLAQQERLLVVSSNILTGGSKLCNQIANNNFGCIYEFEIPKNNNVNAYADGKKVFVTSAMMNFAKTDEELAIVLGHEYAHNLMGHVSSQKNNIILGELIGSIVDIAAESQGISTGSSFGSLGARAGKTKYSKAFEREADYVGLYVTYLSGYNIDQAPEFWRKMSLRDYSSIQDAATHPTNPERYLSLDKIIKEIKAKQASGIELLPNLKGNSS